MKDWKKELAKLDFYWVTNQHKELVKKVIEEALKAQRQSFIELAEKIIQEERYSGAPYALNKLIQTLTPKKLKESK